MADQRGQGDQGEQGGDDRPKYRSGRHVVRQVVRPRHSPSSSDDKPKQSPSPEQKLTPRDPRYYSARARHTREKSESPISDEEQRAAAQKAREEAFAEAVQSTSSVGREPRILADLKAVEAKMAAASLHPSPFINEGDLMTRPLKYKTSKTGTEGQKVTLLCNYVQLKGDLTSTIVQYDVKFDPDEPIRRNRAEFVMKIMSQHGVNETAYTYNRQAIVFMSVQASNQIKQKASMTFQREGEASGVTVTLTRARVIGSAALDDLEIMTFLNNRKNKWLDQYLGLTQLGRSHYDPTKAIRVQEGTTILFLWPGFETSIGHYDSGTMLNLDNRFKIIRSVTMLQVISEHMGQASRQNLRGKEGGAFVEDKICGTIVMAQYADKKRTYRINAVEWNQTIDSFHMETRDSGKTSLRQYYKKKYDLEIKDEKQPLLMAEETGAARFKVKDQNRLCYLVPELVHPTGLTDEMRENFRLMKAIADQTLQKPQLRLEKLYSFMNTFLGDDRVHAELEAWQLEFESSLLTTNARVMKPTGMVQGGKKFSYTTDRADWTTEIRSGKFHLPFANAQGVLYVFPKTLARLAEQFWGEMLQVGRSMGWNPPEPDVLQYDNDRDILRMLRTEIPKRPSTGLVIVILPNKLKNRYDEIKHYLCLESAILSQVVVRRTIEKPGTMKTVATKVALQMGAKLGGAPWGMDMSRFTHKGDIMFVGVDTYHDSGKIAGRSVVAVVGTMNNDSTETHSRVFFQSSRQEIGSELGANVEILLDEYKRRRGKYPGILILYRDGVGNGQLPVVLSNEVSAVTSAVKKRCGQNAGVAFIVVTKRHNTRFIVDRGDGKEAENPVPGTVVDTGCTKPNRMDYYIVSQSVRQGTVSPAYYNILYDDTALTVDNLQNLTYAQSCMYFNWNGPVKVPAQCQNAHKLAFVVGQSLHDVPRQELGSFLYYL